MSAQQPFILASGSPRRKQLLEALGIAFSVQTADTPEDYPKGLSTEEIPVHIAINKAKAVAALQTSPAVILAADTIVALDDQILGKPVDACQARSFLRSLSGRTHQVVTGVCLYYQDTPHGFAVKTDVHFNLLTDDDINYYVDKYAPMDKAGAYGIQEWIGMVGIDYIRGDYYNVVGLPVSAVKKRLDALNLR
ncbi:septum formation protein [Arachidicoccus rhizosphaerae]|uniref:dTTP/UTP pyrophosphatase n=1 Tax=Arachidicoccus rhizosphaerae TaxID=551991 RepID=A0A1H4C4J9_9BACT|nr:Maf family protein [Arachidicoccus rhizosphaerae]SEA55274.1 septum formation protein [Arachidicoccus rhizosphaerae]